MHQFFYLGCTISSDARSNKEVDNRLAKASSAFGRLYERVWNNKNLKIQTKISVYRAVLLTTLLYGSEAWVTYRSHVRLLERFHQRCLRTPMGSGQVSRLEDHRLPKMVLYGELSTGHRDKGAPKKCHKDCLRMCLNVCHIDCLQRRLALHSPQGCFAV